MFDLYSLFYTNTILLFLGRSLAKLQQMLYDILGSFDGVLFFWFAGEEILTLKKDHERVLISGPVAFDEICIPPFASSSKLWETEFRGLVLRTTVRTSCARFSRSVRLKSEAAPRLKRRVVISSRVPGERNTDSACVSPAVAQLRLLGSYKSVLLLSRAEFIRLDSPAPPLVKKEADLSSLPSSRRYPSVLLASRSADDFEFPMLRTTF